MYDSEVMAFVLAMRDAGLLGPGGDDYAFISVGINPGVTSINLIVQCFLIFITCHLCGFWILIYLYRFMCMCMTARMFDLFKLPEFTKNAAV